MCIRDRPNVDTPGQFPGTTLAVGSRGNDVKQMQFYLRIKMCIRDSI